MKMSPRGLAALAQFEGLRTKAYKDSVGVVTIGVGHTAAAGPPKPVMGMTITHQEALDILARDLPQYERAVEKRMPQVPQWVFDGAVSFCFNLGAGNFAKASWVALYAEGKMAQAEASFKQWDKAGGKVLKGLVTRRAREADIIFRNLYPVAAPKAVATVMDETPADISLVAPIPAHPPIPPIVTTAAATAMSASPIGAIISRILHREDVPIENRDVPATVGKVMTAVNAAMDQSKVAVVSVKPSWQSKINLLSGGAIATFAGWFGFHIPQTPEEWARAIVEFAVPALTIVFRTWFTSSVTAASMVPPITKE